MTAARHVCTIVSLSVGLLLFSTSVSSAQQPMQLLGAPCTAGTEQAHRLLRYRERCSRQDDENREAQNRGDPRAGRHHDSLRVSIGGAILAFRNAKRERLRGRLLFVEDDDQVDRPLRRIQAEGARQGLAIG